MTLGIVDTEKKVWILCTGCGKGEQVKEYLLPKHMTGLCMVPDEDMVNKRVPIQRVSELTYEDIGYKSGREGPAHDPYGYEEYTVLVRKDTVTLHVGLGNYVKVNDEIKFENVGFGCEVLRQVFTSLTEIPVEYLEHLVNEQYEPPEVCQHCGHEEFGDSEGYVGEFVLFCQRCKQVVWTEPVTDSMIQ